MKLGFICTNFNNSKFTLDAVRSLIASAGDLHQLRVVVVDNLSSPEQRKILIRIANEFPCVDLLLNDENVGYFSGLNCGLRHMREHYSDVQHLIIGNNDLLFALDFCAQLDAHSSLLDQHAVVSPDIVTLDGEHQNPHVIRAISKGREFVYDLYYLNYRLAQLILWSAKISKRFTDRTDEVSHYESQKIYQGHGSCYLIGPMFLANFPELWAPTFLMGEEYFLSKQLADKNMSVFYTPSIKVTHCCHGSLRSIPSKKIWSLGREAHRIYRSHTDKYNCLITSKIPKDS
jgi:GT2 family glycosyltransferase